MRKCFHNVTFLTLAFLLIIFTSGSALKATNSVYPASGASPVSTAFAKQPAASIQKNKTSKMTYETLPSTFSKYVSSIQSNNNPDKVGDYVKLSANGSTIHIEGKNSTAKGMSAGNTTDSALGLSIWNTISPVTNGTYSFDITWTPSDGNYTLYVCEIIYTGTTISYASPLYAVPITFKNGNWSFPLSSVYDNNISEIQNASYSYTYNGDLSYSEVNTLLALSNQICSGLTDDYSKLKALHDWETKNIYYDYDALNSGTSDGDGYKTLENKRGVCSGYADLYEMLCEAQGLNVYFVSGLASYNICDFSDLSILHAWNLAYVNGNWMNIDTTWDTSNKYEKGTYVQGTQRNLYFDVTNEWFAEDHLIDEIDKLKQIKPTFDTPVYSTQALTKANVTVTVNVADSTQPTLTHKFTDSGTYVFTATDKFGNKSTLPVTVNNIDHTSPTIKASGGNNKKTHSAVKVSVSDTNLGSKTVTLNGKAISWGSGTFSKKGKYVVTAKDSAGNKSTYTFTIY